MHHGRAALRINVGRGVGAHKEVVTMIVSMTSSAAAFKKNDGQGPFPRTLVSCSRKVIVLSFQGGSSDGISG